MRLALLLSSLVVLALAPAPGAVADGVAPKRVILAGAVTYEGGDGTSLETAIVITGASNESEGVAAEYAWVRKHKPGFKPVSQSLSDKNGHSYDSLELESPQGGKLTIFFDITAFFGKL